jgi:hypothetical protein
MGIHRGLNALDLRAAMAARHCAMNPNILDSVRDSAKKSARRQLLALRDLRQRIGADGYKLPA